MTIVYNRVSTPTYAADRIPSNVDTDVNFTVGTRREDCTWTVYHYVSPTNKNDLKVVYGVIQSKDSNLAWEWAKGSEMTLHVSDGDDGWFTEGIVILTGPASVIEGRFSGLKQGTEFKIQVECYANIKTREEDSLEALRARFARESHPNSRAQVVHSNVHLSFPKVDGFEIWTKSNILTSASPYFKTALESGFSEGSLTRNGSRKRKHSESENEDDSALFHDSDDETDEHFKSNGLRSFTSTQTSPHPFHEMVIRQAAFTTYSSLICWIETEFIKFAPLSSTFSAAIRKEERLKFLQNVSEVDPLLPVPSSPKSIYRLAHFLELRKLQDLALKAFKSNLTVENVISELVSDVSRAYPEIQKVAFKFAKTNWDKVKSSQGLARVEKLLEEDEMPGSVGLLLFKLTKEDTKS